MTKEYYFRIPPLAIMLLVSTYYWLSFPWFTYILGAIILICGCVAVPFLIYYMYHHDKILSNLSFDKLIEQHKSTQRILSPKSWAAYGFNIITCVLFYNTGITWLEMTAIVFASLIIATLIMTQMNLQWFAENSELLERAREETNANVNDGDTL